MEATIVICACTALFVGLALCVFVLAFVARERQADREASYQADVHWAQFTLALSEQHQGEREYVLRMIVASNVDGNVPQALQALTRVDHAAKTSVDFLAARAAEREAAMFSPASPEFPVHPETHERMQPVGL